MTARHRLLVSALALLLLVAGGACASPSLYTEENMQPLAGKAGNLAGAILVFSRRQPEKAAGLGETELYAEAVASQPPSIRQSFEKFLMKASPSGVVLVCDPEGTRALIEDSACTTHVDRFSWRDQQPCRFTPEVVAACLRPAPAAAGENQSGFISPHLDLPDEILVIDYAWTHAMNGKIPGSRLSPPDATPPMFLWTKISGNEQALARLAANQLPLHHVWSRKTVVGRFGSPASEITDERNVGIAGERPGTTTLVDKLRWEIDTNGRFDWRTWSRKDNIGPGDWEVRILDHDRKPVRCFIDGTLFEDCSISVTMN
jgi:hypothetical protein